MTAYDGLPETAISERLGLPRVVVLDQIGSTLDVAHELAEQGAPAGTLILADTQHAGRGRMGREWRSLPGHGVWCTVIERPRDPSALDVLSIRVGLGAAEALDGFAGERVGVKWPNDLVLQRGKLGGVLGETRWSGTSPAWVAIGVGVNVIPPPDVAGAAGMRHGVARVDVLEAVVRAIRHAASQAGHLSSDELSRFATRDTLAGARIVSPATGTVAGITASGALIVNTPYGAEQHRTGTVRLAEV